MVPALGAAVVDTARRPEAWPIWLPTLVLLALGQYLVLRLVRRPMTRAASAIATVVVYAFVAAARSWLLEATVASRVDDAAFTARPVPAVVLSIGALVIFSEIAERARFHHEASVSLNATRARLLATASSFDSQVSETREQLRSQIHNSLDPALREILRELQSTPETTTNGGAAARTVDDTLRPLLARLAVQDEPTSNWQLPIGEAPSSRYSLPERVDVASSLRPYRIAFAEALLVVPWVLLANGQQIASVTFPMIGFLWGVAVIVAARRCLAQWRPELPLRVAVPAFICIFLVAIVPPQLGFAQRSLRFDDSYVQVRWMLIVMQFTIAWLVTAAAMIDARLTQVENELERTNAELETIVARLRRELWFERKRLSRVLHGPVQSALVAASLRLASASEPVDASELRRNLEKAVEHVDHSDDAVADLGLGIAQITAVWAGICDVVIDAPSEAMTALESSPSAGAAVTEVVREGVGNAVRHGAATKVDVRILTVDDGRCVRVFVDDNGSGLNSDATPGIGSSILDDVAVSWIRSDLDPCGVRLTADVAL